MERLGSLPTNGRKIISLSKGQRESAKEMRRTIEEIRTGDYGQAVVGSLDWPITRGAIEAVKITGVCGRAEESATAWAEGSSKGLARNAPGVGDRLSVFESTNVLKCPPAPATHRAP